MQNFSRRRAVSPDEPDIELSEQAGVRALHMGGGFLVQSAMRLSAPNDLELVYTRCMMGFMLFHPDPGQILMLGLGGGSLAKFAYHRLPQSKITAVEISPRVVAVARSHFFLPEDDDRLQVVVAEGGDYVARHPASADVLMVDGFDGGSQMPALCSQAFYDHAREALGKRGVMVVNLLSRDRRLQEYLERMERSFGGRVSTMMAEVHGNLVAFAFKRDPGRRAWERLGERAARLEAEFSLPFPEYARRLRRKGP
ncbi:polyamine aminopropyltransferase [Nitrosovibrio sp. Nv17]|uniref:polyamine aminopropyltransferase n=1 Tax=Nitrosovibrio sp. Nv17 TaxID=1855339 RepID=UPI000908FF86|nr:polyamine aminopropyltransferase [Nitrosovibrio sp. Nv17]SFW23380.1 spermidine synthase [Nitrosovibrio sp. Nv17]